MNFINRIISKIYPEIHVYTDGSHKAKWGSWAFVVVRQGKIIYEKSGRNQKTDSHRMEFQAAIEALKHLQIISRGRSKVILHSDSRVLINSATKKSKRSDANFEQSMQLQ